MKLEIHPDYKMASVTCACGNTFQVGSTVDQIKVEVCSNCHPFYTGQMKYVDTAGRVDAFRARMTGKNETVVSKRNRRAEKRLKRVREEQSRTETLAELRNQAKAK
jgi:large subunit ribosomal protein L31